MSVATATFDLKNSTIVRFNKSRTYRALAHAFALAERHAPGAAAYVAERLWFRIPHAQGKRPEWLPGGRRVTLDLHGRRVLAEHWGTGPRVYLVHGWGGYRSQLAMFVPLLLESGYSVIAFDALGHGESDAGPMGAGQGSILDFVASLKAAIAHFGPAHAIVAHSFGSTATAKALREGLAVERLVFIAPMADPQRYMDGFVRLLGGGERIRARLQQRIERRVGLGVETLQVAQLAREFTRPLLVFHDRDDRETSWEDGADIVWAWPQARLVTTVRLGHRRILSSPGVVREAVRFIREGQPAAAAPRILPERSARPKVRAARPPRWAVGAAMHFALVLALSGYTLSLHDALPI